MSAATQLCENAAWSLAAGDASRSKTLMEAACCMVSRRRNPERSGPIVVVEDDPCTREAVTALLLDEGYEVLGFANGAEALAYLKRRPFVALVLLDLMMPVMDGWTFHRAFMGDSTLAGIPVIAISASAESAPPSVRVLPKPLRLDDLISAVSEAVVDGRESAPPSCSD
jgi:CheY-like chemotaxis protein